MTQQIDVYVLESAHTDARLTFLAKLVDKCHRQSLNTLIICDNIAWLNNIDAALWTFPRFIAHERLDEALLPPIPSILLATPDYLSQVNAIGFTVEVCIDELQIVQSHDYPRILVIADQDTTRLKIGRQKYQHYQQQGILPTLHRLDTSS